MTKFSVLIPTYNGEAHLEACLDSLLAQTTSEFEVVVCDDASTDRTWEILQRYAARDSRFRLHRNERNLGLVGNWIRCVELAEGEWLKFLFQDDTLEPRCLEVFARHVDPAKPLWFCKRRFRFGGEVAEAVRRHYRELPSPGTLFSDPEFIAPESLIDTLLTRTRQNFLGEPTAALLHRSVFERYGTFDAELVQFCDFEYWIRIGIHVGIGYIPEELATFRIHAGATSSGNRKRFRSEYLDGLLILNAWCHDPHYEPLRRRAGRLGINLKRQLAERYFWLERYVRELARQRPELAREWETVAAGHPEMRRNPWLYPLKAREWLERHVLWRFKSDPQNPA